MRKNILQIVGIMCFLALCQNYLLYGQQRIPLRKGSVPAGTVEELQKIQNNADIQISNDLANKHIVHSSQMAGELQTIVNRLTRILPLEFSWIPYKVSVINDINYGASAYQNGVIVIDENFVCRQSDPMVIFVIGHEIAHIGLKHGLAENIFKNYLQNELTQLLITRPKPSEVSIKTKELSTRLDDFYFQQEVLADIWGVKPMVALGFRFPNSDEMREYFIDYEYYPKKDARAKMILDEQNTFLNLCDACSRTPQLDLSRLRRNCYGYQKPKK